MIYKDFELKKIDTGEYIILNKFGDRATQHNYKNIKDAKGVVDNVLLKEIGKYRYIPCHYRHYIWTIIDNTIHRYVEIKPGNLLKFTNRRDAMEWCEKNQEKLK